MVHHRSGRNYNYSGASKQEFVEVDLFSPKSDLKTIKYGVSIDFGKDDPKSTLMHNHDAKNYKNLTYFQKIKKSMINQDVNGIQIFKNDPKQMLLSDQIGANLAGGSSCEDLYQSIEDQSDERKIIFHKVNQDGTTTILEEPSNDYIVNL